MACDRRHGAASADAAPYVPAADRRRTAPPRPGRPPPRPAAGARRPDRRDPRRREPAVRRARRDGHDDVADRRPRSASSSRRSTTTSAAARRSSPRSWPRPTSCPSSWSSGSRPTADRARPALPLRPWRRRGAVRAALRHQRGPSRRRSRPRALRRLLDRTPPARAQLRRRSSATASTDGDAARRSSRGSTALTIMANDEGVQNWYRLGTAPLRDQPTIGRSLADLAVGGLLLDARRLDRRTVAARGGGPSLDARRDDFRMSIETIRPVRDHGNDERNTTVPTFDRSAIARRRLTGSEQRRWHACCRHPSLVARLIAACGDATMTVATVRPRRGTVPTVTASSGHGTAASAPSDEASGGRRPRRQADASATAPGRAGSRWPSPRSRASSRRPASTSTSSTSSTTPPRSTHSWPARST